MQLVATVLGAVRDWHCDVYCDVIHSIQAVTIRLSK
jgi:hypothetical protein